jgi:hypothetical protein
MDTVKDVRSGIDKIWYTDEEKADYAFKVSEMVLQRAKLALDESSLRSMTRRIISVSVVFIAEFLTVVLVVLYLTKRSESMINGIWEILKFWATPLAIVLAFYLGYYGLAAIKKAGNDK